MSDYKFPDEQDDSKDNELDDEIIVEVEDKTPPEDRNKAPLPEKIKEELYNDELEDYSTKVKKKLLQMKKLAHDERREKEAALREQNEAVEFAKKLMDENKRLKSNLNSSEKNVLLSVTKTVEMELEQAKKAYREAYDSGDTDRVMEAQERLTEATLKIDKVRNFRPQPVEDEETVVQTPQPRTQEAPKDPSAVAWQQENPWFGEDEEMTSLALGLHEKMRREGVRISSQEYYNRLNTTIRKRFPERFENAEEQDDRPSRKSSVVAPATRTTSAKRVKLSPGELNLAKKFNLTPEQFAAEKIKLEAANG
jgi:uncharacterized protein (UPF0335 family)